MVSGNRKSNKAQWEHFWAGKKDSSEVYSHGGRVVSQILRATSVCGKRVLEVGAGTGRDSLRLVDAGAEVFLLDYAEQSLRMIKELAKKDGKRVFLIKADGVTLPFKDGSFGVVFHQGLLEHFRDPVPLLRENHRVLTGGGICLVDVPQRFHVYTIIKHVMMVFNVWFAGWETEFSVRELRTLVRRIGFQIRWVYGDWMRPSLVYRIARELLMHAGIRLPMYPEGPEALRSLRARFRELIRHFPWTLNTCLDVGVVAEKPSVQQP